MNEIHVGRTWRNHPVEDKCPCPKAECGLVILSQARPECIQHYPDFAQTMRQVHVAENCPGGPHE